MVCVIPACGGWTGEAPVRSEDDPTMRNDHESPDHDIEHRDLHREVTLVPEPRPPTRIAFAREPNVKHGQQKDAND